MSSEPKRKNCYFPPGFEPGTPYILGNIITSTPSQGPIKHTVFYGSMVFQVYVHAPCIHGNTVHCHSNPQYSCSAGRPGMSFSNC